MEEHKLLTGMLLVALVVSVVGTVITVDRLGSMSMSNTLTGALTGEGNVTIESIMEITVTQGTINFGVGNVNSDQNFSLLNSNGTASDGGNWSYSAQAITILNSGNLVANVTIKSSKSNGIDQTNSYICSGDSDLTCGANLQGPSNNQGQGASFAFYIDNDKEGDGNGGRTCGQYTAMNWQQFNDTVSYQRACDCLYTSPNMNEIDMYLEVGVPADAEGVKGADFTIQAISPGSTCQN